tara:strand:+ start:1554 stop:1760 length:207 start_codon:yes stop_codon:yes gene_type:complete
MEKKKNKRYYCLNDQEDIEQYVRETLAELNFSQGRPGLKPIGELGLYRSMMITPCWRDQSQIKKPGRN